jgi:NADPH-dependent 2,4-dienoyl-CoA reductase/sulfur reductase-like enzyme
MIDFYIVASGNNMDRFARVDHWPPTPAPQALHANLAAGIREMTQRPVAALARIVDPNLAERLIAEGTCDMVAMVRATIADPDYAKKLAEDRPQDIRPCVGDSTGCIDRIIEGEPMRCIYNPIIGREAVWGQFDRVATPRKVVVVGGGPGGMEAARRLTLRGHEVTLLEAGGQLGGTARIAAIAYAPNGDFVEWLKDQLDELEVDVRLNTRADMATIRALAPDAVIVATGAIRRAPDIPGKDQPHVHDGASLRALLLGEEAEARKSNASLTQRLAMGAARAVGVTQSPDLVRKASKLWMPVGDRVVIIGGELVGLELAEFLHERGRQVTVIDDEPQFGRGLSPARRPVMLGQMPLDGIVLHEGVSEIRIGDKAVGFVTRAGEKTGALADTVIIAKGAEANTGLYDELSAAGFEAHMVGDCQGVGYIMGAVRNAADVAAAI